MHMRATPSYKYGIASESTSSLDPSDFSLVFSAATTLHARRLPFQVIRTPLQHTPSNKLLGLLLDRKTQNHMTPPHVTKILISENSCSTVLTLCQKQQARNPLDHFGPSSLLHFRTAWVSCPPLIVLQCFHILGRNLTPVSYNLLHLCYRPGRNVRDEWASSFFSDVASTAAQFLSDLHIKRVYLSEILKRYASL
ncbi:hypothetical protein L218DRAFT_492868 [Marasmius fiardii PR-910]|nr:hypothetical protein L218DRAFT_492868 [Marasmius fiardii PR-910]